MRTSTNRWKSMVLAVLLEFTAIAPCLAAPAMSDAQIREAMVAASVASYSGACACPYSIMRNGRRCGGNSAYSKPGGAAPLCFPQDVTTAMVEAFRRQTAAR